MNLDNGQCSTPEYWNGKLLESRAPASAGDETECARAPIDISAAPTRNAALASASIAVVGVADGRLGEGLSIFELLSAAADSAGYSFPADCMDDTGIFISAPDASCLSLSSNIEEQLFALRNAGLRGPFESFAIGELSSYHAIHRALLAIRSGECECAFAGGAAGMFFLKPLISAERAGDLVYDVLVASVSGFVNPDRATQDQLMKRALRSAGLSDAHELSTIQEHEPCLLDHVFYSAQLTSRIFETEQLGRHFYCFQVMADNGRALAFLLSAPAREQFRLESGTELSRYAVILSAPDRARLCVDALRLYSGICESKIDVVCLRAQLSRMWLRPYTMPYGSAPHLRFRRLSMLGPEFTACCSAVYKFFKTAIWRR